ncbi:MAG: hypothetical protein DRR06_02075 [Gammaproteobacteria bacterium]|nr:MAG: hypothetical protein DRR06_02075 [Gammaproteobacteria bacterium]RLA53932.1 MAG: hypothetical protein DRR42_03405 [Gammaproteobacteria bacterium]
MLQDFRDNLKGTAVFIVVLISIPFALVGIDQIFLGGSAAEAELSVNGENITRLEVDRALAIYKQRLFAQYDNLNPAMLDDELLRASVSHQLIRQKVLVQRANKVGLGVADIAYAELLKSIDEFQIEGRFDRDAYEFALRQMGYTQNSYQDFLEANMLISQIASGVGGTGIVTSQDLELAAQLLEQKRDYYYLTLPVADVRETLVIEDSIIEAHYEQNKATYKTEEQVVIDYLELRVDDLMAEITVDEEMVQAQFDAESKEQASSARSRVEHILFANGDDAVNEQRIEEVQAKLAAGEAFNKLAQEYSDDSGSAEQGGDLGYVDPGAFPEAFADALAGLEVGQVSSPVATDSGSHLIRLAEKEAAPVYEQESDRIRGELKTQLAEQLLPERIDRLRELSYNAESLSEVGDELNISVKTSLPFSRAGGEDIATFPNVLSAAFEKGVLQEGYASDVLELDPTRFVVIKLRELLPVRTLPFDEVRQIIADSLQVELAEQMVMDKGEKILEQVRSGADVEELAKQEGLSWQVSIDTRRFGGMVDAGVRDQAFALPARSVLPRVTSFMSGEGDYVVLSLTKVAPGRLDGIPAEQQRNLRGSIQTTRAQREYRSYGTSLVAIAKIEGLN